jgi:hypothetical protein
MNFRSLPPIIGTAQTAAGNALRFLKSGDLQKFDGVSNRQRSSQSDDVDFSARVRSIIAQDRAEQRSAGNASNESNLNSDNANQALQSALPQLLQGILQLLTLLLSQNGLGQGGNNSGGFFRNNDFNGFQNFNSFGNNPSGTITQSRVNGDNVFIGGTSDTNIFGGNPPLQSGSINGQPFVATPFSQSRTPNGFPFNA